MRRLDQSQERELSLRLAGDPKTARAHYALEMCGATAWRTADSRCFAVVFPDHLREVHIIGVGDMGDVLRFIGPMPKGMKVLMSKHLYAQMAHMVEARTMRTIEYHAGNAGTSPSGLPPPNPELDIRELLFSDLPNVQRMPPDASFLFCTYSEPHEVLTRSVAFGVFNGTGIMSLATVELGRSFANVLAFTLPEMRGKGMATLCVASLLDRLRHSGERPLFCIPAENGSPERAMARRFGLERVGEMAMVERRHIAL